MVVVLCLARQAGKGSLDVDDIKMLVAQIHAVKETATSDQQKLAKDTARAEQEAKVAQKKVRAELMDDQRKQEAVDQQAAQAAIEKERRELTTKEKALAKAAAKEQAEEAKKAAFERRLDEKRGSAHN